MISRSKRFAHHADWFLVGLYVGLIAGLLMLHVALSATEITVYGRNSCGFTDNLRNELTASNIPYDYCNIDSAGCLGAMFQVAIEFNLAPSGTVNLPVVLVVVDGKRYGYVRPTLAEILKITSSEVTRSQISVYPNPADQFITVDGDCEIYDMTGMKLIESHDRNVMVEGLKPGAYLVKVRGKNIKLIKKDATPTH